MQELMQPLPQPSDVAKRCSMHTYCHGPCVTPCWWLPHPLLCRERGKRNKNAERHHRSAGGKDRHLHLDRVTSRV
jgi:hypothetical protein